MAEEATTPDLVARAREGNAAASRRDIDTMMSIWGPQPVWDLCPMGLGVFEGSGAIRGFFEDWLGSYDDFEVGEGELVDLGRGVTFGVFVQRGRPAGSSGEVTIRYGSVGVWDAGLMVRVTQYSDIDEGRAAAERLAEERGWTSLREASRNNLSDKASAPTDLTSFKSARGAIGRAAVDRVTIVCDTRFVTPIGRTRAALPIQL